MKLFAVILIAALSVTSHGQKVAGGSASPQTTDTPSQPTDNKVYPISSGVSAPQVVTQVTPITSTENHTGETPSFTSDVGISLIVDQNGNPSRVRVVKPAGHGLDEKAVEAVKKYKFKPAMKNGKPVKVDLYINVNFQIFSEKPTVIQREETKPIQH